MAKKWLKFHCDNCQKDNWLNEDINDILKAKTIAYCIYCGSVKGYPDKEVRINANSSWLQCIALEGIEADQTPGFSSPTDEMTHKTRWATADGSGPKQGLDRTSYMLKYGVDPWTQYCSKKGNEDKPICQNDGFGRSYKNRLKDSSRIDDSGDIPG